MTKKKSAPKAKSKAKSKANGGEGVVSDSGGKAIPMIAEGALRTLNKQMAKFQNDASTAAGSMGDLTRDYADKKNLHKGAYATMKMLNRMGNKDPGKLWLWLAHFDHMRKQEAFGQKTDRTLDDIAQSQGQLLEPGVDGEPEGDDAGEGGGEADNVTSIRTGERVREVAETAGAKLN